MVVLAAALLAGCGGSSSSSHGTLEGYLKRPGPDVSITAGASEFVPGSVRYPFLVIRNDARPVERSTARVWIASSRDRAPFARVTARLEPIGIPGRSAPAFGEVSRIYVAHFRVPRPGRYWVVAEPAEAKIQAVGALEVTARSPSPAVDAKARAPTRPRSPARASRA